jgi:hypothetical protein
MLERIGTDPTHFTPEWIVNEKKRYREYWKVKGLYQRIYQGKEQINELTYKIGRGGGWFYQEQKISRHQLDALLLFHLEKKKVKEKTFLIIV